MAEIRDLALFGAISAALLGLVTFRVSILLSPGSTFPAESLASDSGVASMLAAWIAGWMGALNAPIGWILVRRLPLGSDLAGLFLGSIVGGVMGLVFRFAGNQFVGGLISSVFGYILAAIALHLWGQWLQGPSGPKDPFTP